MNLSKSKYCIARQCLKELWLSINKPEEGIEVTNDKILDNGTEVGNVAKELFKPYVDIEYNSNLEEMIKETKKVILNNKICNITEASFSYNNCFCSVDILKKNNDSYEIYEVKSSTELKSIYIDDALYQYYVLTKCGYKVNKVSIVYINSKYIRKGNLELDKLFNIEDITNIVIDKNNEVECHIQDINRCLNNNEPRIRISSNCFNPYDCPFFNYCTSDLPSPNIFSIVGMKMSKKIDYYNNNKVSFKDLFNEDINIKYLEQIDFELNNKEDKILKQEIKDFLNTLTYPLYFLDFETFQQPIPLYDDVFPYEQIPFQYSLHYLKSNASKVEHKEFLGDADTDPRRKLAEALVKDIPMNVCVLAYHKSFEQSRIKELADIFADLKEHLLNIKDNIKDLEDPFAKRYYYTKDMVGKSSIKYVLPALFPNDPSLNYKNLEDIHNGSEAMNAFANMGNLSKEEQDKLRINLLKYCELDTYAMVKIYEKLKEVTK